MSAIIYIETERNITEPNTYDLVWSISGDDYYSDETVRGVTAEDRLTAAIINLGQALRCLADNKAIGGTIEIRSDKDGKDYRHAREHDILYSLVCPHDDWEARKFRSLYQEYSRYIGRIKQLQGQYDITIKLV